MATFWYATAWLGKIEVHRRIEAHPWESPRRAYLKRGRSIFRTEDAQLAARVARIENETLADDLRKANASALERLTDQ